MFFQIGDSQATAEYHRTNHVGLCSCNMEKKGNS